MWVTASRRLGDLAHAAHTVGTGAIARIRRWPIATVLVFALALGWVAVTGWSTFLRPERFDEKAYERYQEEVAKCRELRTSEARYDCVAKALIGRDQQNFGKAMLVFVPPLVLLLGRYVWREIRASMRERERARLAELKSRRAMSKMRQQMIEERAALIGKGQIEDEARRRRTYNPAAAAAHDTAPPKPAPTPIPRRA